MGWSERDVAAQQRYLLQSGGFLADDLRDSEQFLGLATNLIEVWPLRE